MSTRKSTSGFTIRHRKGQVIGYARRNGNVTTNYDRGHRRISEVKRYR